MNEVNPIRNQKQLIKMKNYLMKKDIKIGTMFILAMEVVLRISDFLKIRWKDILCNDKKTFKEWKLVEQKTRKKRIIKLNSVCTEVMQAYMATLDDIDLDEYVFPSREKNDKPITEKKFLSIINYVLDRKGIELKPVNSKTIKELKNSILLSKINEKLYLKNYKAFVIFNIVLNTEYELDEVLNFTKEYCELNISNFNDELIKLINKLDIDEDGLLFKQYNGDTKPYSREHVWSLLNDAAEYAGIVENVGTHSFRKTWVWKAIQNGESPARIMEITNHNNWDVAKAYAGIKQDEINETYERNSVW